MKNKAIRVALFDTGVKRYELAQLLKVSEMTMYRMLREELPQGEQDRIVKLIREYSSRRQTQ